MAALNGDLCISSLSLCFLYLDPLFVCCLLSLWYLTRDQNSESDFRRRFSIHQRQLFFTLVWLESGQRFSLSIPRREKGFPSVFVLASLFLARLTWPWTSTRYPKERRPKSSTKRLKQMPDDMKRKKDFFFAVKKKKRIFFQGQAEKVHLDRLVGK